MSYRQYRKRFANYTIDALLDLWELVSKEIQSFPQTLVRALHSEMYQRDLLP